MTLGAAGSLFKGTHLGSSEALTVAQQSTCIVLHSACRRRTCDEQTHLLDCEVMLQTWCMLGGVTLKLNSHKPGKTQTYLFVKDKGDSNGRHHLDIVGHQALQVPHDLSSKA